MNADIDKAGLLLMQAEALQKNIAGVIKEIPSIMRGELENKLAQANSSVESYTKTLQRAAHEVEKSVGKTVKAIELERKTTAQKHIALVIATGIVVCILVHGYIKLRMRDIDEINEKTAKAEAALALVEKQGGRMDVTLCDARGQKRICIRIDRSAGEFGQARDYMIPAGY